MKLGMNMLLWTTHVGEAHLPLFDLIKSAGYDGIEVPIFGGDEAHYAWLAGRLKDAGLAATALGVIPDEAHNPISESAVHRADAHDHLSWLVDCASALEAGLLCGPFHSPLGVFSGAGPTPDEFARCADAHRAMAERAASAAITLSVEPLNRFECYFLTTAAEADALAKTVGLPNYGWQYDTFHANIEEKSPVGAIERCGTTLNHVHISENDRGTPGEGHIDLGATLAALRRAGYDGWLTVEAFGQSLPELAAATKVWRPFFPSEAHVVQSAAALLRRLWGVPLDGARA